MKIEKISLVIPCYNEAESIGELYLRISSLSEELSRYLFEFIFINDGSGDGTSEILNQLADKDERVKILHFARNRGHQMAITAGMDFARGEAIVTLDADLQDPPEVIKDLIAKIEDGYDVVHAQRRTRAGETWFKLFSARLFYALIRRFSEIPLIENSGDFRAFTRPVLKVACSFREPHRFHRGNFVLLGFKQCTVSYDRDPRYAGQTKYPFKKMFNFALDALLGFSSIPIKVVMVSSLVLAGFSLIYLVKALLDHYLFMTTVPGWTSLIVFTSFYTSLILFSLAIIGSYVGRIFEQGQRRPLYWLRDVRNIDFNQIEDNHRTVEIALSHNILKARANRN